MPNQEHILFAPLNWGLGHATRIVPLIKESLKKGDKVIIGADGSALAFLQNEFPELETFRLKGFNIKYWRKPFFNLGLLVQMPLFYASTIIEKHRVKILIRKHEITKIISDNRYGIRNGNTHNIILTHQLFIKVPKAFKVFESVVHQLTKILIKKFDECWVPDYAEYERSLSGELSHGRGVPKNVKYIGPLSRFQNYTLKLSEKDMSDVLILISGPEPARSHFEQQMVVRFRNSEKQVFMVCGKPGNKSELIDGNFRKVNHLSTEELCQEIKNSKLIITRSGYSTIMDLHVLGRKAELSPTPGQSEQEYLAEYYKNN